MEILTTGNVELSLEEYNKLRDENASLKAQLEQAIKERDDVYTKKKVRVIYKNEEGRIVDFENLDDVIEELSEQFKENLDAAKKHLDERAKEIKECEAEIEKTAQEIYKKFDELTKHTLEVELENSRLKNRNLWQRIWNK